MNPYLEQPKGQGEQPKARSWIFGGGPVPDLPLTAIAGFDAKSTAIPGTGRPGGEGQMALDKHPPVGLPPVASGAAGGGAHPTDEQGGGELHALETLERMGGA